jgi:GxxExxY protein
MEESGLTRETIGAAIEVHRTMGPGLLESVYEECMALELDRRQISYERQIAVPLAYRGKRLGADLRLDLLVEGQVIVELKAIETILPIHSAQLLTYLRLSQRRFGLLINFNVPILKDGIKRMING